MKKFVVVACFVLLLPLTNFSTDFRYLRTREGLIDGEITAITQDSAGFMWFASYSGLTRFDGINLEIFRPETGHPESLSDKKIKFLFVDSESNLWIGSNRSVSIFNQKRNSFHKIQFERISDNEINILNISEFQKHLVIHTVEGMYLFPLVQCFNQNYKAKKRNFLHRGQLTNQYFHLSKGTGDNLFLVNNLSNQSAEMYSAELFINNGDTLLKMKLLAETDEQINSIDFVKKDTAMYLATSNGIKTFSLNSNKFEKRLYFEGQNIANLLYASNHKLYCSSNSRPVLHCLDMHTGLTSSYTPNPNISGSLLNNRILNLFEDFSGNLWIGHQGQGISILNLFKKEFITFRHNPIAANSLNANTILCFAESNDEYLIGCRSQGLNIVKKNDLFTKNPTFESLNILQAQTNANDGIWDIESQNDSVFWLATESGLFKLSKIRNSWKITPFQGQPAINELIWKIIIDDNNNIWCGTFNGGLIFIPNPERNLENKYYRYLHMPNDSSSLSDNYVKEIFIDSKNRFWVGTLHGLNRLTVSYDNLNLSGNEKPILKFTRYMAGTDIFKELNNNEINCLYENYDGSIWVLTNGGGINILNPDSGNIHYLTVENGLPSNDIYGILPDESGCLWISTLNGLVAYDQLQERKTIHTFDYQDGIQGNVFMVNAYFKAMDGMLFFGGDNGFTCFYPEKIEMNRIKPKIAFNKLYYQSRLIEAGDTLQNGFVLENNLNHTNKIVLPFKRSYFKIEISTLHFQSPQKNKFSYKLDGRMENWYTVSTYNNSVEFANLPFGNYTLYVKALSSDNIESAESKVLEIEIEPPWYLTWYMSTFFMILGFSIIMGFIYILVNRQKLVYQKRIDALTIENNENKMMFLTNIAHELRTPLSLVIAPIEDLMISNQYDANGWKSHFQLIHRNANYLLRLVNQIIDFRKLNAGKLKLNAKKTDIVRVIKDVVLNFKGYESKRNIKLSLEVPSEFVEISVDAQKIEEVLYNLLSNAFKNTFNDGIITVSMSYQKPSGKNKGKIKISVYNEGNEISEADRLKVFERFYKIDEKVDGAGIGLSFSKSLIELHGGKMWVDPVAGKGVIFNVELPFDEIFVSPEKQVIRSGIEQDLVQLEEISVIETAAASTGLKSTTVLVVEDNSELRDFLQLVLSRKYNCLVASNGAEGWEIVKNNVPSVIITDVIMPEMDGYELCEQVKQRKETCHIPVILLTAKNDHNHQIKGYDVGADAFVTKPFEINVLLSQVARLVKNRDLIREKYKSQNFMVEVDSNSSKDEEFIQNVKKLLEENLADPEFNVRMLSNELNISTTQLYRKLKILTGRSPVEFIRLVKLQKAYALLGQKNKTVKEVCYLTGFNNLSYFIKCFKEQFGVTPASYRDNGKKQLYSVHTINNSSS